MRPAVTPARLAVLMARPTESDNVDEDRAIVWERHGSTLTEHEKDVFVALLTLDGPEVVPKNRARWAAIAEQARRDMAPKGEP